MLPRLKNCTMPQQVQLKNGATLTIEDKAFADGGEGELFRILQPETFKDQVVKLFRTEKRTPDRERKVDFLIKNPPKSLGQSGHHPVIWPTQTIYQEGTFAGFTMPLALGEKLELLCHAILPKALGAEWKKFDLKTPGSLDLRLKLCFNIAVAICQIHNLKNYVLVDMKPDNIMIQPNGLISVIDVDSVEVVNNGKVLFPAPVNTAEYTPPEYYNGLKPEVDGAGETWDRFSLAVIFYRLLCATHPFSGSCKPPYDKCSELAEMVKNGLFPNGKNALHFKAIPPPHNQFTKFEKNIREFFIRCFDHGHISPIDRPSAEEWCRVLSPAPVIQINRPLPSSYAKLAVPEATQKVMFSPKITIDFPVLSNPTLTEYTGLKALARAIFGNAKKINLEKEIKSQVNKLEIRSKERIELQNKLLSIINEYHSVQNRILQQEEEKFTRTKNWFKLNISELDNKAKAYFDKEKQELQEAHAQLKTNLLKTDNSVRNLRENLLQPVEDRYQQRIAQLSGELDSLKDKREEEIKKIENKLETALAAIEKQLKDFANVHTNVIDQKLQASLAPILRERREIENEEQVEISHVLESSEDLLLRSFLSQYKISDHAQNIFTDGYADHNLIISNLRRNGITSAADFTAVNESGHIKITNGDWIRVSQVGNFRARSLGNWRARLERNIPANFTASMAQGVQNDAIEAIRERYRPTYARFDKRIDALKQEAQQKIAALSGPMGESRKKAFENKKQLKQDATNKIAAVKSNFATQEEQIKKYFEIVQREYEQGIITVRTQITTSREQLAQKYKNYQVAFEITRNEIIARYDGLHNDIKVEIQGMQYQATLKLNEIKAETDKALDVEIDKCNVDYEAMMRTVNQFITNLHDEIKELKELQTQYKNVA